MEYVAIVLGVMVTVVAIAVLRARSRGRSSDHDPFVLGEPWRHHVAAALSAQRRYDRLITSVQPGPLRTTLDRIAARVRVAVDECWEIAQRGDRLDDTIRILDRQGLHSRLARATDDSTRSSLEQQLASLDRVRWSRNSIDRELHALQTRLGELVSNAAVIAVDADGMGDSYDMLGTGVDAVVVELRALNFAIEEMPDAGGKAPPTA